MAVDLGLEVSTYVTPGLHPQVVAALEDYDSDTEGELRQVVEAFSGAYEGVKKVHAAREAVEQDITLTQAAKVLATSDMADKVLEGVTKRFDRAANNMKVGIALLERELSAPVEARAAHSISVEIRAHVKAMPGLKALDFVRAAINRGDAVSASAVLAAPSYLSGIDPEAQAVLLRMWHEKANPTAGKRLRAMKAAAELMDNNAGLVFTAMSKVVGVYTDPKTKRKFTAADLRKLKQTSTAAFAQLGS